MAINNLSDHRNHRCNHLMQKKILYKEKNNLSLPYSYDHIIHLYHILSHKSCPEFCWGRKQPMRWLPALQDLAIYSPTRDDHYHKGVSHRPLVSLFLIYWWCCIHRTPSCANGGVWMADEDVSLHRQCWKYVNTVQLQHITETSRFPNIILSNKYRIGS